MEFQNSLIINRPLSTVFALAADFENLPKWEGSYLQVKRQSSHTRILGAVYWSKRTVHLLTETPLPGENKFDVISVGMTSSNRSIR